MNEMTMARVATGGVQWRSARAGSWTPAKRNAFLTTLGTTANVSHSAQAAGMNVASAYKLRRRDGGFAEQWGQALSEGYARLEEQALECALRTLTGSMRLDGSEVPVGKSGPKLQERTILALMAQHRQAVAMAREMAARHAAAQAAAEAGGDVVQVVMLEKLHEIRAKLAVVMPAALPGQLSAPLSGPATDAAHDG